MFRKTLLASSAGLAFSLALATPVSADTIAFDYDQDGDFDLVESLDWAPGNALAVDAVPLSLGGTFNTYVQGELTEVVLNGGGTDSTPIGAAGPYEITFVVELNESVLSATDLDGDFIPDQVNFSHTGGTVNIFWDDVTDAIGVNADGFGGNSGLGYDDGTLILTADILPALIGATYSLTNGSLGATLVPLDQFGADDLGVDTIIGSGNATVDADITFLDSDFFDPAAAFDIISFLLNSTLENPFDGVNPELLVAGLAPDYGADDVNGILGPDEAGPEDFHFEADGNSSFRTEAVPEPGSVALLGLGLSMLGAGQLRRRRRNQA